MNCNVIQDLLILYADGCCSDESRSAVEKHLAGCESCRKVLSDMREEPRVEATPVKSAPKSFRRINDWKASVLQSVLLYASFPAAVIHQDNLDIPPGLANNAVQHAFQRFFRIVRRNHNTDKRLSFQLRAPL